MSEQTAATPAATTEEIVSPWRCRKGDPPKQVEMDLESFRALSKFAAKRGMFQTHTPGQALKALLEEFDVVNKC